MPRINVERARGPEGMRLYAIGDVHGSLDLLSAMHDQILAEIDADRPADWRIVHLGDYVDRGQDSRGVLDFLAQKAAGDSRCLALAGNHDLGMLEFVADPDKQSLFALYGGEQTARSYGVDAAFGSDAQSGDTRDALVAAMPRTHLDFLRSLPRSVAFGDFFFCHAGVRPGVPLERQRPEDLIWIREPFLSFPGLLPKVVVHGHTPAPWPEILPHRINVDTGIYRTGVLSAVVIDGGEKRFLQVSS